MINKTDEHNAAIVASKIGKNYRIFDRPAQRIRHYLFGSDMGRDFPALNDISFTVDKGETFGIIGRNGSGKSTLLQILAGILTPTSGELQVNGKVAALLELGSGFNAESTGLENIYMNAAILGVNKKDLDAKLQNIIDFADIGEFLDQPVKTYSSGMYVRLAFAVAINVDADIILIDEALAVGDVFFRQKCYSRLNELKAQGKTIILVTHGMGEVEQFCDRALLLHRGKQLMLDRSQDVVKQYYLISESDNASLPAVADTQGQQVQFVNQSFNDWEMRDDDFYDLAQSNEISNTKARFLKVGLFDDRGRAARVFEQGDDAFFYYEIEIMQDIQCPVVGVTIYNQRNVILYGKSSIQTYTQVPQALVKGQILKVCQKVSLQVEVGEMTFETGISEISPAVYESRSHIPHDELFAAEKRLCHRNGVGVFAVTLQRIGSPTRLTHHGVCNLPTEFRLSVATH